MNNYEKPVYINGALGGDDYRRVLAAIHRAVHEQGYKNIVLDFTGCAAIYPSGILPVISYARALAKAHVDFSLVLPKDAKLAGRFKTLNWAHLIEPRKFKEYLPNSSQSTIPALIFTSATEQQDCVNTMVDSILSTVSGLSRSDFSAVEWALNEITDNVLNHSQSSTGGIVQLIAHRQRRKAIEFTVCDAGLGVARTLRAVKNDITNDIDALAEAVKEGVTRNSRTNQGNGLFGSFEICRISKGNFKLHANNARLEMNRGTVAYKNEKIPLLGTLVDATIDITDSGLLDQALRFKGAIYRPSDIIELQYESNDLEYVNFIMSEQARSYASRVAGKPVRIKLRNLVEMCQGQRIRLDFSGIGVISSSFADEVFGMLFVELGPMRFMRTFSFHNASPTVIGLIDRAMSLRAQQGG